MDGVFYMVRWIRRIISLITLLLLLWVGTVIADFTQRDFSVPESFCAEKIRSVQQTVTGFIDEHGEQIKDTAIDLLIYLDQMLDRILESVSTAEK